MTNDRLTRGLSFQAIVVGRDELERNAPLGRAYIPQCTTMIRPKPIVLGSQDVPRNEDKRLSSGEQGALADLITGYTLARGTLLVLLSLGPTRCRMIVEAFSEVGKQE